MKRNKPVWNQPVCIFLRSIMPSLAKGVFKSFATKVINMFSCFRFYIFFIPKSVYIVKYYYLYNWPWILAIKYQARDSRIEPVQEERTIMWAERSENCLTRVPSWSKRVQKNLVFFMLRLWPDLINIYFLSIERFNRENTRLLVRDKDPSYIYHSTIRATPAPIHIIPSFTYIKKHQHLHTSPYPSIFLIQIYTWWTDKVGWLTNECRK